MWLNLIVNGSASDWSVTNFPNIARERHIHYSGRTNDDGSGRHKSEMIRNNSKKESRSTTMWLCSLILAPSLSYSYRSRLPPANFTGTAQSALLILNALPLNKHEYGVIRCRRGDSISNPLDAHGDLLIHLSMRNVPHPFQ